MIERVGPVPDPRAEGVRSLRRFMALPEDDAEARIERKMLRQMDLLKAIRS